MRTSARTILALACALAILAATRCTPAKRATSPASADPIGPVRIVTDEWGIPHLFAGNRRDLYRAWGWVTARDRLWQLVLTRAQARGDSHRWLGNAALRGDGGAQLFRFGERADSIWAREQSDTATVSALEAYAAGINDYLGECRSGRRAWPDELAELRWVPDPWRPADSVVLLLGYGVTLDLDLPELDEIEALAARGEGAFRARRAPEAGWIFDTMPDTTRGPRARAALGGGAPAARAPAASRVPSLAAARERLAALRRVSPGEDAHASNVFAIGAGRSTSGRPILANDPHLALTTPPAFHVVHVHVPGDVDAIGATVPGLPAIVSGRNRAAAWGVTALSADVCDVYADTLSADGKRARGPNGWSDVITKPYSLAFRVLGVPLPALGQVRRYTAHGPVIDWQPKRRIAYTLRWSAFEDSRISIGALIGVERSRNADEVAAAFSALVTPTLNLAAADTNGRVLWRACGLVPKRWDPPTFGARPSDGAHEWAGFVPTDSMPAWSPPRDGFVVNANNRPAGPWFPYAWPRFDWPHDRAFRIAERLEALPRASAHDVAAVQTDTWSRVSARWVPALLGSVAARRPDLPERARAALDTLAAWDGAVDTARVAPTLMRSWFGVLARRTRTEGQPGLLLAALEHRLPAAASDSLLDGVDAHAAAALATALDTLAAKLGPDLAGWTWARVNRARFRHALAGGGHGEPARWEPPRIPTGGDRSSPAVSGARLPWTFDVAHGPVFRHVVDLAVPDSSSGVLAPYNSAREWKRETTEWMRRWAAHESVPFRMDSLRIEATRADVETLGH